MYGQVIRDIRIIFIKKLYYQIVDNIPLADLKEKQSKG